MQLARTSKRRQVIFPLMLLAFWPARLSAQEPSGLQVAAAIEGSLVQAIGQAEKSVVAIANTARSLRGSAALIVAR